MNEMGGASAPTTFAPTLALVLGLFMIGYSVLLINHITPPTTTTTPIAATNPNPSLFSEAGQLSSSQQPLLAPQAATIYKIAMSLTMAYMLVTML